MSRTQNPIQRLSESLAFDVPQGHIDAGYRLKRQPLASVAAHLPEHVRPQPLCGKRIVSDQQWFQLRRD